MAKLRRLNLYMALPCIPICHSRLCDTSKGLYKKSNSNRKFQTLTMRFFQKDSIEQNFDNRTCAAYGSFFFRDGKYYFVHAIFQNSYNKWLVSKFGKLDGSCRCESAVPLLLHRKARTDLTVERFAVW
jgi:hypothetical protein